MSLVGLRLHPRRHERRQVEPRVAVEHELVVNDLVGGVWRHAPVADDEPVHLGEFAWARELGADADALVVAAVLVEGHGRSLSFGRSGAGT